MRTLPCLLLMLGWLTVRAQQVVPFTDSNLPIVVIDTRGQPIRDEPKIASRFRVIAHPNGQRNALADAPTDYDGWIGIEIRGNSSQYFPKLSYGLELWTDSLGTDEVNTSLCGMPAEHDWILSASYSDKTLLRNALTYHLARQMGHYAARTVPCEVVLNDQYRGVYMLVEKLKRGSHRVAISKLNPADSTGDKLTGGYIIKLDNTTGGNGAGWFSAVAPPASLVGQQIHFQYDYPKDADLIPQQRTYIQAYVDSFEAALQGPHFRDTAQGYARYIDRASFTDYLLLNEASRNVDGYRLSTFLHKNRRSQSGGGRLVMGPVWDYDLAWHNAYHCDSYLTTGWAWRFNSVCGGDGWQVPFWWERLSQDSAFNTLTRCRWQELRRPSQPLATLTITTWLDSMATVLRESRARNFQAWPILGQYVWPNPEPIAPDYAEELANLKNWLAARLRWLDANLPGAGQSTIPAPTDALLADAAAVTLWPNPVDAGQVPRCTFALTRPATVWLEVTDATGRRLAASAPVRQEAGVRTLPVPGSLTSGLYVVQLWSHEGPLVMKRLLADR